ncbi:non-glycosylated envelope protein [Kibale red colobus virus 2]|uniref:Non-glycosylated envelope protein n=1 Tax=Kibale red colobus virus 2 TaxID=1936072 RepID=X2D5E8_9NIDO|nr:non-glycosylated envelope protein [Kibale red colobus virus 2]AHH53947.1 non-glycosylated envelope protein [Kibale red colobus virus 2]AHH53975.1 non-glycosylated envelope protein [Kibale red colobus virus 2]AHH54003.1 non-glycosylated envelope protein [Kibale red colobus virus 2]AHH54059.1 non-glycosylated envelope protein [Kibale red colobus virus 2]AHH54241.1 non-glycosylated envelope protein [Kibale red colobus virus 2]
MVNTICMDPGYTTLAFTAGPIIIACLRLFRPALRGIACLIAASVLAYAATAFSEHSLATIVTIAFSIAYLGFKFCEWVVIRCRMCRHGRRYITAPASFIESSFGRHAIPHSSVAVVSRRPGSTMVNGRLVPDVKKIMLAGRVAAKKGLVNLRKYGWQTKQ